MCCLAVALRQAGTVQPHSAAHDLAAVAGAFAAEHAQQRGVSPADFECGCCGLWQDPGRQQGTGALDGRLTLLLVSVGLDAEWRGEGTVAGRGGREGMQALSADVSGAATCRAACASMRTACLPAQQATHLLVNMSCE